MNRVGTPSFSTPSCTLLAILLLALTGCSTRQQSQFDMLASRFTVAAENLEAQRAKTLVALQDASEAQAIAVSQEQFDFKSPETEAFVLKWQNAETEVSLLRRDVTTTISSCYEMLGGLRIRAEAINDEEIRNQTVAYVDQKRVEFDGAVRTTQGAIATMEQAMLLGNDIIESLRIVGTANLVRQKIGQLEDMKNEAIARFPDVDTIIDEGRKFLNLELAG